MNWFKSLKEYFLGDRKEILQQLALLNNNVESLSHKADEDVKLYKSKRKIGNNTIVVFNDGVSLSSKDENGDIYHELSHCKTEEEIIDLFTKIEIEIEKELKNKDFSILKRNSDFIVRGNDVYLNGVSLKMPDDVVANFIEILERQLVEGNSFQNSDAYLKLKDNYNRLKYFWLKLATSPVKDRDNVLLHCKNNDIKLSKSGNIISYRRVNKYEKFNSSLRDFIKESFIKVKKWKKSPKNYNVYDDNGYVIVEIGKKHDNNNFLGVLSELEFEMHFSNALYTSHHNPGKYIFSIPGLYKMTDEIPNPDLSICSTHGLHSACVDFDYSSFGSVPVVTLINPASAIHVPTSDSGKFRTSEMYIACINPNSYGVHIEEELIEEADKIYNKHTIEDLQEVLKSKSFDSLSIENYVPEVNLLDVKNIINVLSNKVIYI